MAADFETTPAGWTIIDRDAAVLTDSYSFAKNASSNCFIARMGNGQLMVVSPPTGLNDAAAAELAEFGAVGAIVANNGFHHLGQVEWRARYPEARCFAPEHAAERIAKKNPAALPFEPLTALAELAGDDVGFREVPDSKCGESWFWAKVGADGYAWYVSDVLANMPSLPKNFMIKMMFKLTKSAPGYRPFGLALKFIVKDKKATLRLLRDDLVAHVPAVIVPAHGGLLTQDSLLSDTHAVIDTAL